MLKKTGKIQAYCICHYTVGNIFGKQYFQSPKLSFKLFSLLTF